MELKRVVVTGMGAITPLGKSVSEYWDGLINGVSGADNITQFDTSKFKTKFACEVKNFNPLNYFEKQEVRKKADQSFLGLSVGRYKHELTEAVAQKRGIGG